MSVLIRGMDMPTDGSRITITIYSNGDCDEPNWQWDSTHLQGVQAVPLPPHGRLIDADELIKDECNHCDGECEIVDCDCLGCKNNCRCDFIKGVLEMPTIVEAEEGE